MDKQAKVLMASFVFFAIVMEENKLLKDMPKGLMKLYRKLGWNTKNYYHHLKDVNKEMDCILKGVDKKVDYVLLSVSIIAEYYEQMRGNKRYFTPMSWKEIVALQDECLETCDDLATDTFDVAELLVKELLK